MKTYFHFITIIILLVCALYIQSPLLAEDGSVTLSGGVYVCKITNNEGELFKLQKGTLKSARSSVVVTQTKDNISKLQARILAAAAKVKSLSQKKPQTDKIKKQLAAAKASLSNLKIKKSELQKLISEIKSCGKGTLTPVPTPTAVPTVRPSATPIQPFTACSGETYDTDGVTATGCELTDSPSNHDTVNASDRGNLPCTDTSSDLVTGFMLSDAKLHPDLSGVFSSSVGAAPDYFRILATGGACVTDFSVTFTTFNGGSTPCYQVTLISDKGNFTSSTISGDSATTLTHGSGGYTASTSIYLKVEKVCSTVSESVTYSLNYHL